MDPQVFELARQLQNKLGLIDGQTEPGTFESVHGLSIELIARLEGAIPPFEEEKGES
jgi:hypothetical protein